MWRVSSAAYPVANAGGNHVYSEGPNCLSRAWAPLLDRHTLSIGLDGVGSQLVDFQRGVGFSNWRTSPNNFQNISFSNRADSPRICYYITTSGTDATINRYDTEAGALAPLGVFPKTITSFNDIPAWFQHDKDDRWFTFQRGDVVYAWDSITDTVLPGRTVSGLDEHYLDLDGGWVLLNNAARPGTIWDLSTDSVTTFNPTGLGSIFHMPSLRGYWVVADVNTGAGTLPMVRIPAAANAAGQALIKSFAGYTPSLHRSSWPQATNDLTQYLLHSDFSFFSWGAGNEIPGNSLTYVRLDGGSTRLLAHVFTDVIGEGQYWDCPRAQPSGDGRVVLFGANSMNRTGRYDPYLVEVPLAA